VSFNQISGVEHARNQEYVHRVNVDRGWYDKPVSFLEAMALLMTEVVEVSDAYAEEGLLGGWAARGQMTSEFADCYIRLVDDASRFMVDLSVVVDTYRHGYEQRKANSFDGMCMQLVRRIRDAIESYRTEGLDDRGGVTTETRKHLAYFFLQLQDTCDELGVNLMQAFNIKMAINETRPYRHGNKHA
jgi:NTP pyrophosphatase (non-canonical NTP hydrolase)